MITGMNQDYSYHELCLRAARPNRYIEKEYYQLVSVSARNLYPLPPSPRHSKSNVSDNKRNVQMA